MRMEVRAVKAYFWLVRNVIPAKLNYFCAMNVVAHATTGKYSGTDTNTITAIDAIKRYADDHNINKTGSTEGWNN